MEPSSRSTRPSLHRLPLAAVDPLAARSTAKPAPDGGSRGVRTRAAGDPARRISSGTTGHDLALVLTGGGARAAYQVGLLKFLARRFPDFAPPILTGVSAGALNAVALANHPGSLPSAVEELVELWSNLTVDQVFRVDRRSLASHAARFGLRLVSGGSASAPRFTSLVDTTPLRELVSRVVTRDGHALAGIDANLASERLRAVAVTTTCYATGRSVTWFQGAAADPWSRPQRMGIRTQLGVDHVLASAALPLLFPAVRIGETWHGDGDVRLAAPLSPALHMGARRILAVSTRYAAFEPAATGGGAYPPPAQVIGTILNTVFLDMLEQDALRLVQVNELLLRGECAPPPGLNPVDLFVIRPSQDPGVLAHEFESHLPSALRFLTRGLGTREAPSADSLSFILFEPRYLRALIALGERDAESYAHALESFLAGGLCRSSAEDCRRSAAGSVS